MDMLNCCSFWLWRGQVSDVNTAWEFKWFMWPLSKNFFCHFQCWLLTFLSLGWWEVEEFPCFYLSSSPSLDTANSILSGTTVLPSSAILLKNKHFAFGMCSVVSCGMYTLNTFQRWILLDASSRDWGCPLLITQFSASRCFLSQVIGFILRNIYTLYVWKVKFCFVCIKLELRNYFPYDWNSHSQQLSLKYLWTV